MTTTPTKLSRRNRPLCDCGEPLPMHRSTKSADGSRGQYKARCRECDAKLAIERRRQLHAAKRPANGGRSA